MNRPNDLPLKNIDPDDEVCNTSSNESFNNVLQVRLSRRGMMRVSMASAAAAFFGPMGLSACGSGSRNRGDAGIIDSGAQEQLLGFNAVAKSLADVVSVPTGYTVTVLYALGDPLRSATPAYQNDGTDTDFEHRAGDHHDGMEYFGLSASGTPDPTSSTRALLAINHEATSHANGEWASPYLHADGGTLTSPRPISEIDKEIAAHGVSIIEVARANNGSFSYVVDSSFNGRVTPNTPVQLSGQAVGSALLVTRYSSTLASGGNNARGTINNCGTGRTPWGTMLTGEENFNGYFRRATGDNATRNDKSVAALNRYSRAQGANSRHGWETGGATGDDRYARWDITQTGAAAAADYRNELNTFGYMVEIDPYNRNSPIKKRTSLGRFAHESGSFGKLVAGKPLAVYMGDDARGEYMYKFVSAANWNPADASAANRMGMGDKYLDNGKLYVAKFHDDGSGEWIELNRNAIPAGYTTYAFDDDADVLINARLAADAVGATRMDRPEWCAVHPTTGEIYYTLTNNTSRLATSTSTRPDAANPRAYTDDGVSGNVNGHIIRIRENNGEHDATSFQWDVYLFGAQADANGNRINLSGLTDDQDFSSPDGMVFSPSTGICWIQTDDGYYTDVTNCMMLAAIPGQVGDGAARTLAYQDAGGNDYNVTTYVGKRATSDTLKRFLVGPVDCEITGLCETPDGRALFVNVQHPGETISKASITDPSAWTSHWPANAGYGAGGENGRPRTATIVITKDDGGRIGT